MLLCHLSIIENGHRTRARIYVIAAPFPVFQKWLLFLLANLNFPPLKIRRPRLEPPPPQSGPAYRFTQVRNWL